MKGMIVAALGHLEAAIMDRLWSWDRPVAVRDVLEDLQRERTLAYTTVMTVLDNLHRKRMVMREKDGRAYLYRPTRSREAYTAELMRGVLSQTPDRGSTLLRFVEQMSAEEVAELRQFLDHADSAGKSEEQA